MHIILIIGKKIGHRLKRRKSEHDGYIEEKGKEHCSFRIQRSH
jgi:hypothetical protein